MQVVVVLPGLTLDPLAMPPELIKAHAALDRAYRRTAFTSEAQSVAFPFDRYEALTNALFVKCPEALRSADPQARSPAVARPSPLPRGTV